MGFEFLNTIMLGGLAGLSVPVLIHLISRWKAPRHDFPTIRFLEQVKTEASRMQKLRHLLLLILRLLIITFIVLAFARPFLAKKGGKWTTGSQKVNVIILDNSYSMGYMNNFQKAKEEAVKIINNLAVTDKVALISCSDKIVTEGVLAEKFKFNMKSIDNIKLSYRTTDFEQAVKKAEEILFETPASQKIIYLITDNQAYGWAKYDFSQNLSPGIEMKIIKVSKDNADNSAVIGAEQEGEGYRYSINKIKAKIFNIGGSDKNLNVSLDLDGNKLNQNISVKANQVKNADFTVFAKLESAHEGFISISDEGLSADNKYYFATTPIAALPLLIIYKDVKDRLYVEKALTPLGIKNLFNTKFATEGAASTELLEKYKAVLILNLPKINDALLTKLKTYVKQGGGVFISMGSNVNILDYNSKAMNEIMPASFSSVEGDLLKKTYGIGMVPQNLDSNILLNMIDPKYADWANIKIYKYIKIKEKQELGEIVLSYENGDPAVLEKKLGDGTIILFTSGTDGVWNNFVLTPLFLPFIHQSIYSLCKFADKNTQLNVGDVVAAGVKIAGPDNKEAAPGSEYEVPGIYKSTGKDGKIEKLAVNVNTKEGALVFSEAKEIESKLNNKLNEFSEVKGNYLFWSKKEQEEQHQWWWYCILAAIIFATIEMFVANYKVYE
ncbi:MAG: hypothetical protein A2231_08885 [Candidatus Firestonebacteria bacterium RIFOXYA2_FULL_40_8]|nr:MAG: hypothetical protein A2231_08885 [Candidatus Firestonebacteria bacterium RIFOXYA2_FULL_40_8]